MRSYGNYSDVELFSLLSEEKKEAFDIIYDRYFVELVNKAFKRLGSEEEAREMVQDVFVQLYIKRTQIAHTDNLPGYLHTLLKNKIIDRHRQQLVIKKNQLLHQQAHALATHETPGANMDGKFPVKKINTLIDALPHKCREVFLLSRGD